MVTGRPVPSRFETSFMFKRLFFATLLACLYWPSSPLILKYITSTTTIRMPKTMQ